MVEIFVGLGIGLVFFIAVLSAYMTGIRHGKCLAEGNIKEMKLPSILPVMNREKKEEQPVNALDDILSYSIDTALNAIRKGVE